MKNNLFPVNEGKKKSDLPLMQLKHFTARGAYTMAKTLSGKEYLKSINIGKIEKLVKPSGLFFRSHESHLLNILHVNWNERISNGTCALIDGSRMLVARRKQKAFKKLRAKMTAGK